LNEKQYVNYIFVIAALTLLSGCGSSSSTGENDLKAEDQYIVVFKKAPVQSAMSEAGRSANRGFIIEAMASAIASRHGIQKRRSFSVALQGGLYRMTGAQALELSADPDVAYIEKDHFISVNATRLNPTWGPDRIDQVSLPLDNSYTFSENGSLVNAYVIDTGILASHNEFEGRAVSGVDLVDDDGDSNDCNGHGTHVAASIGGATFGVTKKVKLIGVRVLNCFGSGQFSDVIAGIEWVTANHIKPAVANMSLGGPVSQAVDDAVVASIQAGVTYVVAAGNENVAACGSSPARVANAITVGSTTITDARSSFSNYGNCVDIFAPGSDIKSAWYTSNSATNTISGTSMAAPHVAGVAALYLAKNPAALPAEVASALISGSSVGKVSNAGAGSPNRLLNTAFLDGAIPDPDPEPEPEPIDSELSNGVAVTSIASDKDGEKYFTIRVPAKTLKLSIEISGGSGDADLYVRAGSKPSASQYDCRPYKGGNSESCVVSAPAEGVYHVMLRAYSAYAGLSLKAVVTPEVQEVAPCTDCSKYSGSLSAKGAFAYHPNDRFDAAAGIQQIFLSGPDNADFDIYLYRLQNGSFVQVASSVRLKSAEQISYQGVAGTYQLKVISYNGGGSYNLYLKKP